MSKLASTIDVDIHIPLCLSSSLLLLSLYVFPNSIISDSFDNLSHFINLLCNICKFLFPKISLISSLSLRNTIAYH